MKAASVCDFADEGTRILMVIWPLVVIWFSMAVPRLMDCNYLKAKSESVVYRCYWKAKSEKCYLKAKSESWGPVGERWGLWKDISSEVVTTPHANTGQVALIFFPGNHVG